LNIAGQDLFDTHKEIGTYLTLAFIVLMILQFFSSHIKKEGIRYLVTVLMIVSFIALFHEIKSGHELVYEYGAGTQMEYVDN
jgi:predicted ferric reductase